MNDQKLSGGRPLPIFSIFNAIAIIVGIVVGIGIFRLPPLVAQNAGSAWEFLLFWIAGGIVSILGALCYAELAAAHPDAGGEYHFLHRAFGPSLGFLFSWGRMTVIQTGSIALAAFILGDYASLLLDLGPYSSPIYAGITVCLLTMLNIWGTHPSKRTQNVLTGTIIVLLMVVAVLSFLKDSTTAPLFAPGNPPSSSGSAGMAMIFVLLTYGGWNEAAYLSAELKNVRQNMVRVLVLGLSLITLLYVLINIAYLDVLGFETLRNAETVGADLTEYLVGSGGAIFMAVIVIITASSTANATIITGARTNYALGRDFQFIGFLGQWSKRNNTPINALLIQGAIALLLVIFGAFTKESITTMVDYTAPVFWFFLMLTGMALFIFRYRYPDGSRPFKVPLYPVIPVLFVATTVFMLYSSLTFTGIGALFGVGILLVGVPVLIWGRNRKTG